MRTTCPKPRAWSLCGGRRWFPLDVTSPTSTNSLARTRSKESKEAMKVSRMWKIWIWLIHSGIAMPFIILQDRVQDFWYYQAWWHWSWHLWSLQQAKLRHTLVQEASWPAYNLPIPTALNFIHGKHDMKYFWIHLSGKSHWWPHLIQVPRNGFSKDSAGVLMEFVHFWGDAFQPAYWCTVYNCQILNGNFLC